MRRIYLLLILTSLLTFATTSLSAKDLYFPHVASDGNWETEVGIVNAGDTELQGTLYAYNSGGSLLESKAISLAAYGRTALIIGEDFLNSAQITHLKFEAGEASCSGYEKFYQAGYRVAVPAVATVNTGNLYLTHIASDSNWWTGLALVNTNASARTLTLTFSDGSQASLDLAANEHWAGTIQGSFPGIDASAVESAVISGASGVIGLELFGSFPQSGNSYLSGVLLSGQAATSLYYPHVASDSRWWTGIVSYNPNSTATTLNVTSYDAQGVALASFPVDIAAYGKYIGTAESLSLPAATAWFKVEGSAAVTGFELFGTQDGSQLAGYSAVDIDTTDGAFVKLDQEGWTGIAFVNITSDLAQVTLTAVDDSGASVATTVFNLPANGKQVALAEDFFSSDISEATYIRFNSGQAVVGFQLNGSADEMMLDALPGLSPAESEVFDHPYGINNWQWPQSTLDLFAQAGLDSYRVMVNWEDFEPAKGTLVWNETDQKSYRDAMSQAAARNLKVSLVVYSAPDWAMDDSLRKLSYNPEDYASFVTALLTHSEVVYPGVVEAIEVENETPTNTWVASEGAPVYGTDQRDPSQTYQNILKAADVAIDAFNAANNTSILTVMDSIWDGAYHHLDELYQLGCGNTFDRINFHYYLMEQSSTDAGKPADPDDSSTVWHFPTVLAYLKHIADEWGDDNKLVWLTEFGWRYGGQPGYTDFDNFSPDTQEEQNKADYTSALLSASRDSGYVERTNLYVGTASPLDTMSLLYVQKDWAPGSNEDHIQTPLFDMYVETAAAETVWQPDAASGISPIPAADADLLLITPDFEQGSEGWTGVERDTGIAHNGTASGFLSVVNGETAAATIAYPVEAGRLYEVQFWIRIDAATPDACIAHPSVSQLILSDDEAESWNPPNYWGVVDTGNYPQRWRRIRFPYVATAGTGQISVEVGVAGTCDVWLDDLRVTGLQL